MPGVPYIFANVTSNQPLLELDVNFATQITLGTSSLGLGNTTLNLSGLSNIQIGSGDVVSTLVTGTYVPTDHSGAGLSLTVTRATYMQIGTHVWVELDITYPATGDGTTASIMLGALPNCASQPQGLFAVYYGGSALLAGGLNQGTNVMVFFTSAGIPITNTNLSTATVRCQFFYSTV